MDADKKATEKGLTMKLEQEYNGCLRNRIKGQKEVGGAIKDFPYDSCSLKQQLYASKNSNSAISSSDMLVASRSSNIISAESDIPWYYGTQKVKMA